MGLQIIHTYAGRQRSEKAFLEEKTPYIR